MSRVVSINHRKQEVTYEDAGRIVTVPFKPATIDITDGKIVIENNIAHFIPNSLPPAPSEPQNTLLSQELEKIVGDLGEPASTEEPPAEVSPPPEKPKLKAKKKIL